MEYVALGKTSLLVSRTAFGAMSLDCKEIEDFGENADEKACAIVHQAYDAGVNFFDIAHSHEVCEQRLGASLHGIRQNVILATKTSAHTVEKLRYDLKASRDALESDYIDLYQIENPDKLPRPKDDSGIYDELLSLKKLEIIRHIGLATENIDIAKEAVESGLYETIQFPFNLLSGEEAKNIVYLCKEKEVGCIAMQPLNGGVMSNIPLAFGFLRQYENVVPVWGFHTQEELQQILYFDSHPPVIDDQFKMEAERLRAFFN